jgi:hypothetical protein
VTDATIITLIILAVLTLVILVLAGLVLSARSFTQLADLIRYLGSLVEQLHREDLQRRITLLREMGPNIKSFPPGDGVITQDKAD